VLPRLIIAGAVAATIIGAAVVIDLATTRPDPAPVTLAEAEALLDQAVRLAQDGDFDGLCDTVGGLDSGICRGLLESARDMHRTPGGVAPTVVNSTRDEHNLILHLRGVTGEGVPYTADFPVRRESSGPRCFMPVYWSGVRFEPTV
jgi:hypothetical protein